jgi:hypothetical protein
VLLLSASRRHEHAMHRPVDSIERTAAPGARKILRRNGTVEMWQSEATRLPSQRGSAVRYFVGVAGADVRSFDRPHQAWEYFQRTTGAPAEPPDLPPDIPESMQRRQPRPRSRRRATAASMSGELTVRALSGTM